VKRSGTPGWNQQGSEPAEAGDRARLSKQAMPKKISRTTTLTLVALCFNKLSTLNHRSAARSRGLVIFADSYLGFRFAPPEALCYRLLRRLGIIPFSEL
jgi:hypothetical protein